MMRNRALPLLSTLVMIGAPAMAQDAATRAPAAPSTTDPADIIVTAERRASSVQKTAASVSVRDGEDLRQRGRFTLAQILEDVPGVTVGGVGTPESPGLSVVIRGVVPNIAPAGPSAVPTTALYVDGVYSGIGGDYDIARVEVLRGPQGTLYGRSATGGVVSTATRDPELGTVTGDALGEFGNYKLSHQMGAVNVPVGDMLAVRVSGNRYVRDGFVSAEGGHDRLEEGRAKLLFQPTDNVSIVASAALRNEHANSGGTVLSLSAPNTYAATTQPVFSSQNRFRQYSATATWSLGGMTLTYIPAYRTWEQGGQQLIGNVIRQDNNQPLDHFLTQEMRLASGPGSRLQWLGGVYYYDNKLVNRITTHWIASGALVFDQAVRKRTKDTGFFGEATYPIGDATRITAGMRYDVTNIQTNEDYTVNASPNTAGGPTSPTFFLPEVLNTISITGETGHRRFHNFTYKARIEHDLAPGHLVYGLVSTGFLPGDVQATTGANAGATTVVVLPYDQEKLTAYEVGTKNQLLGNRLTLNGDVFYYRYTGYQASINTAMGPSPAFVILTAPARMKGAEIEGGFRLTADDRLSFNYAHIAARFVKQPAAFATYVYQDRIPNIAPDTATVGYDRTFHIAGSNLLLHGDVRYAGGHDLASVNPGYVSAGALDYVHVGNVALFDASLTWTAPHGLFTLTGYARNLTKRDAKASVALNGAGGPPGTPPPLLPFTATAVPVEPRTFAAVLQVHF